MGKDKRKPVPRPVGGKSKPNAGSSTVGTGKPIAPRSVLNMHAHADDDELCHPVWRLSLLDVDYDGTWSWRRAGDAVVEIVKFLSEMEKLTWREIREQRVPSEGGRMRHRHHSQDISTLCEEARARLRELGLDEWDELFRFRVNSTGRLWGVLSHEAPRVFYPVWYDVDHQVYPVNHG